MAVHQLQRDLRVALVVFGQQRRQAPGGARVDGADAQCAVGLGVGRDGAAGFIDQCKDAFAIPQKQLTGGTDLQPSARTGEQHGAQFVFQLFDARGDIGRHAVQVLSRQRNTAALGHRLDHPELAQFHGSLPLSSELLINHLFAAPGLTDIDFCKHCG